MPTSTATLKLVRQTHLYFGVFIAPAILFFAFTGAVQTIDFKSPPLWIYKLTTLHQHQILTMPHRRRHRLPAAASPMVDKLVAPRIPAAAPRPLRDPPMPKSRIAMKTFFLLVTFGLFTSAFSGIYMAYKYNRSKLVITVLLSAGAIIPFIITCFGNS